MICVRSTFVHDNDNGDVVPILRCIRNALISNAAADIVQALGSVARFLISRFLSDGFSKSAILYYGLLSKEKGIVIV